MKGIVFVLAAIAALGTCCVGAIAVSTHVAACGSGDGCSNPPPKDPP